MNWIERIFSARKHEIKKIFRVGDEAFVKYGLTVERVVITEILRAPRIMDVIRFKIKRGDGEPFGPFSMPLHDFCGNHYSVDPTESVNEIEC